MAEDRTVAGTSPSADELQDRVDNLKEQHDHGSSEGKPDPMTAENATGDPNMPKWASQPADARSASGTYRSRC